MLFDCKSRQIITKTYHEYRSVSEIEFRRLTWCHTIPALAYLTRDYTARNIEQLIALYINNKGFLTSTPDPEIGYLFYSFKYGFCRNVIAEDREERTKEHLTALQKVLESGIQPFTDDYYRQLESMSQPEIKTFLETNLVNFPGRVINGSHRAFAMAGHLMRGGQYEPFYSMDLT